MWQNSRTQTVTKLKKTNCDKIWKIKLWPNNCNSCDVFERLHDCVWSGQFFLVFLVFWWKKLFGEKRFFSETLLQKKFCENFVGNFFLVKKDFFVKKSFLVTTVTTVTIVTTVTTVTTVTSVITVTTVTTVTTVNR